MIMHLSEEKKEAFQQWLDETVNHKRGSCSMCGSSDPLLVSPNIFRFDEQDRSDKEAQFLAVRCGHCGVTYFFVGSVVGLQV